MSDHKPAIKLSPSRPLTHSEMIIDLVDMPPDEEITLNIIGPIAQPYWVSLKTDRFGQAQLIWRSQAAGEYKIRVRGAGLNLTEAFEISYQAGEEDLIARGAVATGIDVKTVDEPAVDGPAGKPAKAKPKRATRRK